VPIQRFPILLTRAAAAKRPNRAIRQRSGYVLKAQSDLQRRGSFIMRPIPGLLLALASVMFLALGAFGQELTIQPNQTEGLGSGKELVFTYTQQFYGTHEPFDDLNHNGKVAAIDPYECQRAVCAIGVQPKIDPTGAPGFDYRQALGDRSFL
jgi:hypothetical protein